MVCGFDVAVVRSGLISELYTVITGPRGDGPSQLLQAFIGYLRARPTAVDSGSAVTAAARDQRLALPERIALLSPLADLTFGGASIEQRKHLDPLVTREMLESSVVDYLAGADPRDPRCSAIFADMQGFPPMLIQVGENEILYDDATRIRDAATAAGVDVSFESWRHGIHDWPVFISAGLPESAAAVERLAAFFKT